MIMVDDVYDPVTGKGAVGERKEFVFKGERLYLPQSMRDSEKITARMSRVAFEKARMKHDFEFWAYRCVKIRHKLTGRNVDFVLNRPQRMVLEQLEGMRLRGEPIRLILLKARQWGGSTLVQMYMAWIQIIHRRNWHSLICAHVKDTAANIRGMYSTMLSAYPERYWDEEDAPGFKPFERMSNTRVISGRDCRVTLGSSESQEGARGLDCAMAHLSEVAFWKDSRSSTPEDFARAIISGIPLVPYSLIVIESTANGVGNFFHDMWLKAVNGESAFRPVFIPWYSIEMNHLGIGDPDAFRRSLDERERCLVDEGVALEAINWYRAKRLEAASPLAMQAEYPATPLEAFVATDTSIFSSGDIDRLREYCREVKPLMVMQPWEEHEVKDIPEILSLSPDEVAFKVWHDVEPEGGYVTVVDVGGRAASSDYSVIAVIRYPDAGTPRPVVVAQWRGHIDHDLLAWKAVAVSIHYNDALLVVESNTLETERSENDASYILDRIARRYRNLYVRERSDTPRSVVESRYGFHTNVSTKPLIIGHLIKMVRECGWIERDNEACNELATYERKPSGVYGAKRGYHDDILMTRAIGLYVISQTAADRAADGRVATWIDR